MKIWMMSIGLMLLGTGLLAQTAQELLDDMLQAIDEARRIQFNIQTKERFKSGEAKLSALVRLNTQPHQIYMKMSSPDKGIEILWNDGENENRALINPNGFPYVNLSFSPYHSRMRKNSHHPILRMGFQYTAKLVRHELTLLDRPIDEQFIIKGEVTWKGRPCYYVQSVHDDFKYMPYTLKKNEYLRDVADRLHVSEHMIMEKNGIKGFDKIKRGTTILVPNYYAKRIEFYIDKETKLPILQKIYDDQGLYEYFGYTNVRINPTFAQDEFKKGFKEYGF